MTESIASLSRESLSLVEDRALRQALEAAYDSQSGVAAVAAADRVFRAVTSSQWPDDKICGFISGWRSTHGTAIFVSGLIIRLLREASNSVLDKSVLLNQVAAEVGEIIAEDTGLDDVLHSKRFAEFANCVVGDDRWKLDRYTQPSCEKFREFVGNQRLVSSLEEAILTTAASENWNTGEYAYFHELATSWMSQTLGKPRIVVKQTIGYLSAHIGETERGHFLHALTAWRLYCHASGTVAEPEKAREVFERYLEAISIAFEELSLPFERHLRSR